MGAESASSVRPLDLEPMVKEIVRELRRRLPAGIFMKFEWRRGCRPVRIETAQLRLLLTELVLNSKDAMEAGGRLHVWLAGLLFGPRDVPPVHGMSPGPWAVLSVTDTGIGVGPEALPRVFEPGFTTKKGRAGMGLARVRETVRGLGGFVEFSSGLGQGAAFTCYLPAVSAAEFASPSKTILLVDDDPDSAEVGKRLVEGLGYRVLAAHSGPQALKLWEARRAEIAAVIADLSMPGMSGLDLFRELKARDPAVRVLVASGWAFHEVIEQPSLRELSGWLEKPFRLDRVDAALARALSA